MEEDIKKIEYFLDLVDETIDENIEVEEIEIKELRQAIENLINRNKELEEKNKELNERLQEEINENCQLKAELYGNSISKDKIRDDIKELEREKNIITGQHIRGIKVYTAMDIVNAEILRLQELLEE